MGTEEGHKDLLLDGVDRIDPETVARGGIFRALNGVIYLSFLAWGQVGTKKHSLWKKRGVPVLQILYTERGIAMGMTS